MFGYFLMASGYIMFLCILGYFLTLHFKVALLHIIPPAFILLALSYIYDVIRNKKYCNTTAKVIDVALAMYLLYFAMAASHNLNHWYETGETLLVASNFGLLYVLKWAALGLLLGGLLFYLTHTLGNYFKRRKREIQSAQEEIEREIAWRREQEQEFLERVRAYKATYGSNSYS